MMIRKFAKNVLRPILTPMRPGNIAMFHIGRCGSTVLATLLRQHPRIFWSSEFYVQYFLEWEKENQGKEVAGEMPEDAIDLIKRDMRQAFHRYYGFEIKPFHLRLIGYAPESYLQHLDTLGYTHFILLDRKNRLRKIVSSIIAHKNKKKYHVEGNVKAEKNRVYVNVDKVEIDYDSKPLIDYLKDYDDQFSNLETLLEGRKMLHLTYEEHIQEDPKIGYLQMCNFLRIKPKDVSVRLSRTNPFPVREIIENIEDVQRVLQGTAYEWMLDS